MEIAQSSILRPNEDALLVTEDTPDVKRGQMPAADHPLECPKSHVDTTKVGLQTRPRRFCFSLWM
jgi:hypothetical protein